MPFPTYSPTLPEALRDAVERHADREFIVCGDQRLTFRDVDRESARLAKGLLALGVGQGTSVGIVMPNAPEWILNFLAATRIGAVATPFSTLFQPAELGWVIPFADVNTLLVTRDYIGHDYVDRIERALPGLNEATDSKIFLKEAPYLRRIVVWGDCDRPWSLAGPNVLHEAADREPRIDDDLLRRVEDQVVPSDRLLMIYTSGSTAAPKGVVHSHGAVIRLTNVLCETFDFTPGDRLLPQMPFFWLGGLNYNFFPALYNGVTLVLPQSNDPGEVLDVLLKERCNHILGWPSQMQGLRLHPKFSQNDFSFMKPNKLGLVHPAPTGSSEFTSGGLGMTETFGPHSRARRGVPAPKRAGAMGLEIEWIERKIVGPQTGEEAEAGEFGELLVRGYSLMEGLYKKERSEVFTQDGFYPTGDRCAIEADGYLYFDGRLGEMLKVRGANVAPIEVELALQAMPDVQEAAVLGVPDGSGGDTLVAVIVPAAGKSPTAENLRSALKVRVSSYKVPSTFVFREFSELPRTGSNKLHKVELKRRLLSGELSSS
jgi:acyl-CoA synthetase (AMP-forming)/AMP-acid ligase II